MKKVLVIVGILILTGAAVAVSEVKGKPELEMRYKITINVQTPEGLKSGSSVRGFIIDKFKGFNPDKADFNSKIHGEAVVVDLGDKKLFGLLDWDTYNEIFYAFPSEGAPLSEEGVKYYKNLPVGTTAMLDNKSHWPKMVTFDDVSDPMSVQPVDFNDLSKAFGEGVKLQDIQIEITDEKTEWSIEEILPWINQYHNKLFDGRRIHTNKAENKLVNSLGAGSFIIRRKK